MLGKLISVSLSGEKSWLDMLSFLVEKTLVSETKDMEYRELGD